MVANRGTEMRMFSYGGLMGLALLMGWIALSHADDFRPFNRKPTLANDMMIVLTEIERPVIAS